MVSISISKCRTDVKGNRDASHLTATFEWLFSGQRGLAIKKTLAQPATGHPRAPFARGH